ncbi:NRDE family protein [Mycobacterium sp. CPCC 205372]|uniref:NRDE family protein n=1 Tax=Mycobacterium hippophais TaxID=3016340 RepID=A0ABT4PS20_9MYCO|nr:NRDE family protein [Mycobacterium hippophais]MCZ8379361.1 NRDE family protein [Mycobacterium hippophais]
MCLVLIGWRAHPDYRLIVAANRDEYHVRRSTALQTWPEAPGLIAGRDLDCGSAGPGIWLGLRRDDPEYRFAAITNVHDGGQARPDAGSRGGIVRDFLCENRDSPQQYAHRVTSAADEALPGYQLLVCDLRDLWWAGNRSTSSPRRLDPGFHAVGNDAEPHAVNDEGAAAEGAASLKARRGLEAFAATVATTTGSIESYFTMLSDRTPVPADGGSAGGLPPTLHRMFSARFVSNSLYGTRCSTVVLIREDGTYTVAERSYGPRGRRVDDVAFEGRMATVGGLR